MLKIRPASDHLGSSGILVHASDGIIVHLPAPQISRSFEAAQNWAPSLNDRPAQTQPLSGSGIWAGAGMTTDVSGAGMVTSRGTG
jgi:hypothetical protein